MSGTGVDNDGGSTEDGLCGSVMVTDGGGNAGGNAPGEAGGAVEVDTGVCAVASGASVTSTGTIIDCNCCVTLDTEWFPPI